MNLNDFSRTLKLSHMTINNLNLIFIFVFMECVQFFDIYRIIIMMQVIMTD